MLWLADLNHGASEVGASVGPGAGLHLMLTFVGRALAFGWLGYELHHYLGW